MLLRVCCTHSDPLLLHLAQLSPANSNAWSAGAWTGLLRMSTNPLTWADASGAQVGSIPWCPGEPNNKDAAENCAALLTVCSSPGTALVNDYPCGWPLRVVCAVDDAPECIAPGVVPAPTPSNNQGGGSAGNCSRQVRPTEADWHAAGSRAACTSKGCATLLDSDLHRNSPLCCCARSSTAGVSAAASPAQLAPMPPPRANAAKSTTSASA
jgi:hypothetical protein